MNLLILGDVMGASGRKALYNKLPDLIKKYKINFVIVNGENSSDDGKGTIITSGIFDLVLIGSSMPNSLTVNTSFFIHG